MRERPAPAREALLYETLPDGRVRCNVCRRRCTIPDGSFGVCKMRQAVAGRIRLYNYPGVGSVNNDPVEKKPLFHFFPGSACLSLGSWGCNFHCKHCQNWQISFATPEEALSQSHDLMPDDAVALAKRLGSEGMAFTYNEPGIWLEYALDCARLAKSAGLYTVFVTNGFSTIEALDLIGPYLDAYRVDLKGFSDTFYRQLAKVPRWREVLESAVYAKRHWDMHVEVVTNVIPTMNDDDEQLTAAARWIRDELGPETPWHVTAFQPHHELRHLPPTPVSTLEKAMAIGRNEGLLYVYPGNVFGHPDENTRCPGCGADVISRAGYRIALRALSSDGRCARCGADLNIRTASYQRRLPVSAGS
ncbi:MAG: AmmeMemoRadiSam system radical SAM enzyme [Dehalococcoidia bacterium]|nr:AmmeMemoRadiSam system radical SAM enzyme [Dehalococcoidia bacterium]